MRRHFHQSFLFVVLCGGVIIGVVLVNFSDGIINDFLHFFTSPYWLIVAGLVFTCAYFHPTCAFLAVVFATGILVGLVRAATKQSFAPEVEAVANVRDFFATKIYSLLPAEEASLGVAYLMGIKSGLSASFTKSLRVAGLTHVVVASGTHLSILIGATRKVFGKISRRAGLVFALIFIFGFMAIVGFSPSIMRAGLVSAMSFIAWYTGRKFAPWRIILIVATITLLIEPAFLNNLGWQLSFASFGGIMIIAPLLTKYLYGRKKPSFLAQTIIATAAATLMTAPFSLYHFGALSIVAFVANLIILPTLPYVMGLTFATGIIGGLPVAGSLISLATEFALKIHIAVINFFGSQEIFQIEMPRDQPQAPLI